MRCPKCGTINPPEEQLTYCRNCGVELRVVCPRCHADNAGYEEYCRECGLELYPERGHTRVGGMRVGRGDDEDAPLFSRSAQFIIGGLVIAAVLWIPIFFTLRQRSQFGTCQSNLKRMVIALQQYSRDNQSVLPLAEGWTPAILPYLKDRAVLACPSREARVGYAFNSNISGATWYLAPGSETIGFFEAAGGTTNLAGTDLDWLKPPAHSKGNNVAFLSGSVKFLSQAPELGFWGLSGPPAQPTERPDDNRPGDNHNGGPRDENTQGDQSPTPAAPAPDTSTPSAPPAPDLPVQPPVVQPPPAPPAPGATASP